MVYSTMFYMLPLQVALFFRPSLNLTMYWGATEDGRQVTHHQNPDFKNIEHYIDDVSKNNEIGLI